MLVVAMSGVMFAVVSVILACIAICAVSVFIWMNVGSLRKELTEACKEFNAEIAKALSFLKN